MKGITNVELSDWLNIFKKYSYTKVTPLNANKHKLSNTWGRLQTTRGIDEQNIVFYAEIVMDTTTLNSECKDT
jgi:hypothetical protein